MKFWLFALGLLVWAQPIFSQQKAERNELPGSERELETEYQKRIGRDKINGVYIPKNLDDMFAQLDRMTDEKSKAKVKALPEDSVDLRMHVKLGLWMKINWSFYEGSRLGHYLRSAGVTHPDHQASFCIIAWHRHLNSRPIDIKELATRFREMSKKEQAEALREGELLKEETKKKDATGGKN